MNRTTRKHPTWAWARKKEIEHIFNRDKIISIDIATNAYGIARNALDQYDTDNQNVLLGNLINEILQMADITDDLFYR